MPIKRWIVFKKKNQNQLPSVHEVTLKVSVYKKVERKEMEKYTQGKLVPQNSRSSFITLRNAELHDKSLS